jgi:hypothetical protein
MWFQHIIQQLEISFGLHSSSSSSSQENSSMYRAPHSYASVSLVMNMNCDMRIIVHRLYAVVSVYVYMSLETRVIAKHYIVRSDYLWLKPFIRLISVICIICTKFLYKMSKYGWNLWLYKFCVQKTFEVQFVTLQIRCKLYVWSTICDCTNSVYTWRLKYNLWRHKFGVHMTFEVQFVTVQIRCTHDVLSTICDGTNSVYTWRLKYNLWRYKFGVHMTFEVQFQIQS